MLWFLSLCAYLLGWQKLHRRVKMEDLESLTLCFLVLQSTYISTQSVNNELRGVL